VEKSDDVAIDVAHAHASDEMVDKNVDVASCFK